MSEPAIDDDGNAGPSCPADERRTFLEGLDRGERVAVAYATDDGHAGFRGSVEDVSVSPVSERLAGVVVDGDGGARWRVMYWGSVDYWSPGRRVWICTGRWADVCQAGGTE